MLNAGEFFGDMLASGRMGIASEMTIRDPGEDDNDCFVQKTIQNEVRIY